MASQTVLTKIQSEYNASWNSRSEIIQQKKNDLRLYIHQGKNEETLQNSLMYSTINTYAAMSYSDTPLVQFMGREIGDDERAAQLTQMAEFDYDDSGDADDELLLAVHRGLLGPNITVFTGWDDKLNRPRKRRVNSLSWFPDPDGHTHAKNFRYMGFVAETTINTLKEIGGYKNLDQIDTAVSKDLREVQKEAERDAFNKQDTQFMHDEDSPISIYIHYTKINGVPKVFTLANNLKLVLKEDTIPDTMQNVAGSAFPIALKYRVAAEWSPWGITIADELRDKQRALTILDNLMLIAEKEKSIGIGYAFNENKVRGEDLDNSDPFDVRLIPVDGDVNNAVQALQWAGPSVSGFNVAQSLERDANLATGIWAAQSGVLTDESKTATEIQAIQANSNLRQLFTNRITLRGVKHEWTLWYKSYVTYFGEKDEKVVRILGALRNRIKIFRRSDIVTQTDPDIKIESRAEVEAKVQKSKADILATYATDLQDPDVSDIGKRMLKKKVKEFQGFDRDEIAVMYEQTPDERQAWLDIALINDNEFIPVENLEEDHQTFITVYQNAEDTPAKYGSIEARRQAMSLKDTMMRNREQQPQPQNGAANQMQAQFSNSAIQQNKKKELQSQNVSNI